MASTSWIEPAHTGTTWGNSRSISNLGVIMNDTVYLMNSTTATMNDEKNNPIYAAPTAFTKITSSASAWTKEVA